MKMCYHQRCCDRITHESISTRCKRGLRIFYMYQFYLTLTLFIKELKFYVQVFGQSFIASLQVLSIYTFPIFQSFLSLKCLWIPLHYYFTECLCGTVLGLSFFHVVSKQSSIHYTYSQISLKHLHFKLNNFTCLRSTFCWPFCCSGTF